MQLIGTSLACSLSDTTVPFLDAASDRTLPYRAPEYHRLPPGWVELSIEAFKTPPRATQNIYDLRVRIAHGSEGSRRAAIVSSVDHSAGDDSRFVIQDALRLALFKQHEPLLDALSNSQLAAIQLGRMTKAEDPIVCVLLWDVIDVFSRTPGESSVSSVESLIWALNGVAPTILTTQQRELQELNLRCTRPDGSEPTSESLRASFKELVARRTELQEQFEQTIGRYIRRNSGEDLFLRCVDLLSVLPYRSETTIEAAVCSASIQLTHGPECFDSYQHLYPWIEQQLDPPLPAPQRLEDVLQLFIEPRYEIDEKFLDVLGRVFERHFGEVKTVESMIVRDRAEDSKSLEGAALEWMERRDPTLLPDIRLVFRALSSPEERARLIELLPKFLQDPLTFDSYLIKELLASEQYQRSHESFFDVVACRLETTESSDTRAMLSQSLIPMAFYASPEIRIKAIELLGRYGEEPIDRIIKLLTLLAIDVDEAPALKGAAGASVSAAAEKRLSEI